MKPKQFATEVLKAKEITVNKEIIELNSNIDQKEGDFLSNIVEQNYYKKSIEIGCAYGISSLFICDALQKSATPSHIIIDPFQNTDWKGIGIENLNKCGVTFYNLIEKPSEIALPELLEKGEKFDFAFIDGWHTFDHTLIDFFYLNRMLEIGGTIVIDDVCLPSVKKLVHYVLNYPAYELLDAVPLDISKNRKLFNNFFISPLKFGSKLFPKKIKNELFNPAFINSGKSLGIQASMVALKKVKEDERKWHWYQPF